MEYDDQKAVVKTSMEKKGDSGAKSLMSDLAEFYPSFCIHWKH